MNLAPVSAGAQTPGASSAPADSLLPNDTSVVVGTLPNGLRYYVRANPRPLHRRSS